MLFLIINIWILYYSLDNVFYETIIGFSNFIEYFFCTSFYQSLTIVIIKKPILLDGAMGTELVSRGVKVYFTFVSTEANLSNPSLVTNIHQKLCR